MADQQTRVVVICPGDQDDRRMIVALRIYHRCESGATMPLEVMLESGAITETGASIQDIRAVLHTSGARVIDVEAARDERSQSAR